MKTALDTVEPPSIIEVWCSVSSALITYKVLYTPIVSIDIQRRAGRSADRVGRVSVAYSSRRVMELLVCPCDLTPSLGFTGVLAPPSCS